jgi:glucose/arabinose dehydrogenase
VAVLPTGFLNEQVVHFPFNGDPTSFTRLPDGRIVIIERTTGNVRLAAAGVPTSVIIHTMPNVNTVGFERGFLGVMVDPQWPVRPYLYFHYNHTIGKVYITMLTASGDLSNPASTNVTLGSPFHLLTDLPDNSEAHNGGSLRFAPDGMLLLSIGDDNQPCGSLELGTLVGKILRIDISKMPGAGSGPPPKADITPPDNPFSGPGENERLVYAWGLRNPFRFGIDSETGDVMIGDVGAELREEVDLLPADDPGLNYGWGVREGDQQGCCPECPPGSEFTEPVYVYPHAVTPQTVIGGAIVRRPPGAATPFPIEYDGSFFFAEFFDGWIRRLVDTGSGWQLAAPVPGQPNATDWATGIGTISDMQLAPDGAVYYCKMTGTDRGVYRIRPHAALGAPVAEGIASGARVFVDPTPVRAGTSTRIRWEGATAPVTLGLVDATGRRIHTIVQGDVRASGEIAWNGLADDAVLPAGVYFVRLESSGRIASSAKLVIFR